MPESRLHKPSLQPDSLNHELKGKPSPDDYSIRRKGSRYNIIGPAGREFTKYKSASVAGPRWEELTGTPWPYESSAYQPGTRLWQLGDLPKERVGLTGDLMPETPAVAPDRVTAEISGASPDVTPQQKEGEKRQIQLFPDDQQKDERSQPLTRLVPPREDSPDLPVAQASAPHGEKRAQPVGLKRLPKPVWPSAQRAASRKPAATKPAMPVMVDAGPGDAPLPAPEAVTIAMPVAEDPGPEVFLTPDGTFAGPASSLLLALPAPRLDLAVHEQRMTALRRNPGLLFDAETRQALRDEVAYHRPYARWAQYLLNLLAKYERRQHRMRMRRAQVRKKQIDSQAILAKHIAWQETIAQPTG